MGRYDTGYRLEHRVERLYARHGWLTTRYPKSGRRLYPADVLAVKRAGGQTLIHLVECKNLSKDNRSSDTIYLEKAQIQKLTETAEKHRARALVAYSFPRQRPQILYAKSLRSSGKMLCVRRGDGMPIKSFLQTLDDKA